VFSGPDYVDARLHVLMKDLKEKTAIEVNIALPEGKSASDAVILFDCSRLK